MSATSSPDELRLVSGISQAVAPAVDNALKYDEAQQYLVEADRLQSSTQALLEMQSVDDVLAITAREAQRIVGAEGAVALLHDGSKDPRRATCRKCSFDSHRTAAANGLRPETLQRSRFRWQSRGKPSEPLS